MPKNYNEIVKYKITAVCTQPLHVGSAIGDKEAVLIHPVDEVPFIQASSISGVLRGYIQTVYGDNITDEMFGARALEEDANASDFGSKVKVEDGLFINDSIRMELRPRVKINGVTGSCDSTKVKGTSHNSGQKFNMEYVAAGSEFEFLVFVYGDSYVQKIEEAFAALNMEIIQFGGQKSNGCGTINIKKVLRKKFDMTDEKDRKAWSNEDELAESDYVNCTSELKEIEDNTYRYEVLVHGTTDGEMLIKSIGITDYGKDSPDSMNIQNANKDYIIPGSSLKGAIRAQMEKIAGYMKLDGVIDDTFGIMSESEEKSKTGNIIFTDVVVGDKKDNDLNRLSHRIHIDKFTGGVTHGGLFTEKNVFGNLDFKIKIKNKDIPEKSCALLLYALRDLAIGNMSLGGGYNIGKGFVNIDRIEIISSEGKKKAIVMVNDGSISGDTELVQDCLASLKEV